MLKILLERRSIRKYKDKKIEEEKINQILAAGKVAPSGKNKKPWEFVIVEDREVLKKLSMVKPKGGLFLAETPVSIAVIGNEEISDTWVEDCSIASAFIQLEACNQGLGSCWVQMKNRFTKDGGDAEEAAKEILEIPTNKRLLCIIALGYPDQERPAYKEEDYL
ncbi:MULTISPECIES: nitroreductase family protein [Psychrilyobacter]|uniref:NAD(P)H nitroreductase n=1 Tax=Psychrilyobacter piezotolerans TaxID=2293438 RepID=A0ABX9KH70_9FUSO|nr:MULTISPECIES: nitroreductase family protein [Psychrilyobacter]MCS5422360.1 nitroreductase family protein [Psychrilyobacter sp. S5]NDI78045.1 NAD(P)H nitroreductase [Psychrilyobacter piezotolerans]RDE61981.1 NAD(P)H nitroreductase [Psychrilyobacter sp. S5]REI41207.1 NAD(P)H nitroreductase [Psychrilyobacter piezotolerans]